MLDVHLYNSATNLQRMSHARCTPPQQALSIIVIINTVLIFVIVVVGIIIIIIITSISTGHQFAKLQRFVFQRWLTFHNFRDCRLKCSVLATDMFQCTYLKRIDLAFHHTRPVRRIPSPLIMFVHRVAAVHFFPQVFALSGLKDLRRFMTLGVPV